MEMRRCYGAAINYAIADGIMRRGTTAKFMLLLTLLGVYPQLLLKFRESCRKVL